MNSSSQRTIYTVLMAILILLGNSLILKSYSLYGVCGLFLLQNITIFKDKIFVNKEIGVSFLFILFSGLSFIWAMDSSLVMYRFKILMFIFIFILIFTNQHYKYRDFEMYISNFTYIGIILSVLCILYFKPSQIFKMITGGIRLGMDDALFMGINSNIISLNCATACLLCLYYFLFKENKKLIFGMIPTFIIVVATGSRKGMLMLLIGIILLIYFYQRYTGTQKYMSVLKILIVIFVLLAILQYVISLPMFEKLNEQYMGLINSVLGKDTGIDLSTASRNRMVTIGLEQFEKTPLFGIGLDNAKIINLRYNNYSAYLHNNYIEILANGGLTGFILYYSFFIQILIKHIKRLEEKKPIVYISLIMLVIRLLSDWGRVSYFDYMNMVCFPFWIAVANKFDETES